MLGETVVYQAVLEGVFRIDSMGRIWRGDRRAESHPRTYLHVRIMHAGVRYIAMAHRLVWIHLHGPIPEGLTVNHINGDKVDNRPSNLELATRAEQIRHAIDVLKRHGCLTQLGEANHHAKLTASDATAIRVRYAGGEFMKSIAPDFGVSLTTISAIVRRKSWSHLEDGVPARGRFL